jgi:biopolymer transport protein ExbD
MRFKKYIRHDPGAPIDIAPINLIDILFVLLLFFMLTFNPQQSSAIKIDLPEAKEVSGQTVKKVEIAVTQDGTYFFNGEPATLGDIKDRLSVDMDGLDSVFIKADKATSFGAVVTVWDLCKRSGITQINVAVRRAA